MTGNCRLSLRDLLGESDKTPGRISVAVSAIDRSGNESTPVRKNATLVLPKSIDGKHHKSNRQEAHNLAFRHP